MNLSLILFLTFISYIYVIYQLFEREMIPDKKWIVFVGIVSMFIVGIGFMTIRADYFDDVHYEKEVHTYYIQSLGNDKYTEGDFFLGSGNINDIDYYYFYVNTVKGMQRRKVEMNRTFLIETDTRRPEYVKIFDCYDDEHLFWKTFDDGVEDYKILYVPKGTIIRDFKVR